MHENFLYLKYCKLFHYVQPITVHYKFMSKFFLKM